jgi:hypothetical protein
MRLHTPAAKLAASHRRQAGVAAASLSFPQPQGICTQGARAQAHTKPSNATTHTKHNQERRATTSDTNHATATPKRPAGEQAMCVYVACCFVLHAPTAYGQQPTTRAHTTPGFTTRWP